MNQKTIFVVEDDTVLRTVLLEKLSQSGYLVEGAEDGSIALQKLHAGFRPDLILLDILMPHKNGMEVLEEMNGDQALKSIPVMIISNSGQPVEIERAKKLGARDFLIKAVFDPSEVLEKARVLLGEQIGQDVPKGETHVDLDYDTAHAGSDAAKARTDGVVGQRALVVEDDKFLRDLFVRKLTTIGLDVRHAVDGKEAFSILEQWKPDIILLDLLLPDVDGFEILARLKKDERLAAVPVMILSNLGQQEDIDRAMHLGAKGFMVKANFNLEEIASRVQEVLSETPVSEKA
ncbi:MAG: hypothetical protein B7X04_02555 [Parcubacteria group bacterium 21-54-25]|nr:MAG: hypothetical protein B7X04_02555 [Parcubacteria group bacterium 21-54-25]HQU07764.1 response regulator [Candidatus Paceibacterota bacterium]